MQLSFTQPCVPAGAMGSPGLRPSSTPQFSGHTTQAGITAVMLSLATNLHATGAVLPPAVKLPDSVTGASVATCRAMADTFKREIAPKLVSTIEAIQGKAHSPEQVNRAIKATRGFITCGPVTPGAKPVEMTVFEVPILKTTPNTACQQIATQMTPELKQEVRLTLNRAKDLAVGWQINCYLPNPPKIITPNPERVVTIPFIKPKAYPV